MTRPRRLAARTPLVLAALASALAIATLVRCKGNPAEPLLRPTGGLASGVISGVLDYGPDFAPPYPETFVYTVLDYDDRCASVYDVIHILGEMNGWDTGLWRDDAASMTKIAPCFWAQRMTLAADDSLQWKFTTDRDWPHSYATATCRGCEIDRERRTGGTDDTNGDNLWVKTPAAGDYVFVLNEYASPVRFTIPSVADTANPFLAKADPQTGAFRFVGLEEGEYALAIAAEGLPVRVVPGVRVRGSAGTDVGRLSVVLTGGILGRVAFNDDPTPRPRVLAIATAAGSGDAAARDTLGPDEETFRLGGLNTGTYSVRLHADGYVDTLVTGIAYTSGTDVDLGTIVLARGGSIAVRVAFADAPPVPPVAAFTAFRTGTTAALPTTVTALPEGAYRIAGLPTGSIDLAIRAAGYLDTTLVAVVVNAPNETDVGIVTLRPGCRSVATTIHILGAFNGWDETLWQTDPGMTQVGNCEWRDTLSIFPYYVPLPGGFFPEFKFTTDRDYDATPDYVLCFERLDEYANLSGPVCLMSGGPNLFLPAVYSAGRYEIVLDEDSLRFHGALLEEFTARIGGTLFFEGNPSPRPAATVSVYGAGDDLLLARATSSTSNGTFFVEDLDGGTYDLRIAAPGFLDEALTSIAVLDGEVVIVEPDTLAEGCTSAFNVIRVVGDFNGWNTSIPSMTQVSPCVWADTLSVPESGLCTYLKFRTAEDWGANDYGGCEPENPTCPGVIPLSGSLCPGSGGSEPPALGKIQFPAAGDYVFRLDERTRTYTIAPVE